MENRKKSCESNLYAFTRGENEMSEKLTSMVTTTTAMTYIYTMMWYSVYLVIFGAVVVLRSPISPMIHHGLMSSRKRKKISTPTSIYSVLILSLWCHFSMLNFIKNNAKEIWVVAYVYSHGRYFDWKNHN